MNELYFLGMDIVEETKTLVNFSSILSTDGMTDSELKAYKMGIENTLSALQGMLQNNDDMAVINIDGLEIPTEISADELEEYYDTMYLT